MRVSIFRPVVGYEGLYLVSDRGEVRSLGRVVRNRNGFCRKRARTLKPGTTRDGYQYVTLSDQDGRIKGYRVHRLVLEAFVGPCPEGMEARHFPDRNPANNNLNNLSWSTHKANQHDKKAQGTLVVGSRIHTSRFDEGDIKRIRTLSLTLNQTQIARLFKVHPSSISDIMTGKSWKHVA